MSSYENCPGKVQRCLKTKVILFKKFRKDFDPVINCDVIKKNTVIALQ